MEPSRDPTSHLLQYHTDLLRLAESVRRIYSRYLPLFILACAETAALFVSSAIKLGNDTSMSLHNLAIWIQTQPLLYINLALLPPLFMIGYLVLLAVLMRREQYYEKRAMSVRQEIETVLQNQSNLVLHGPPLTASLLERVTHRPTSSLPRQPMAPNRLKPEARIGVPPSTLPPAPPPVPPMPPSAYKFPDPAE